MSLSASASSRPTISQTSSSPPPSRGPDPAAEVEVGQHAREAQHRLGGCAGWRRPARAPSGPRRSRRRPSRGSCACRAESSPRRSRSAPRRRRGGTPAGRRRRRAARAPARRAARRRRDSPGAGQRDAQHPQHHVSGLEAAARVEEGVGVVAQHRARGDAPEQRRAALHVADERVRAAVVGDADRGVGETQVHGVDRLPHLGADHVAHGARALARALEARDHGVGVRGVGAEQGDRLGARGPHRVALALPGRRRAHDRQHRVPGQRHARRVIGTPLKVGLEDAVDHARRQLGPRDVAPEPEQLVGDPREHQGGGCRAAAAAAAPGRSRSAGAGSAASAARTPRRAPARAPAPRRPGAPRCPWSRRRARS